MIIISFILSGCGCRRCKIKFSKKGHSIVGGYGGGVGSKVRAGPYKIGFGHGLGIGFSSDKKSFSYGLGSALAYSVKGPGINIQHSQSFGSGFGSSIH